MFYLESRPTQSVYGGNATRMEPGNSYAFPLFLLMQKVLSKLTKEEVNAVIWITPA